MSAHRNVVHVIQHGDNAPMACKVYARPILATHEVNELKSQLCMRVSDLRENLSFA